MNSKSLGFAGAAVLAVGLFTPIMTVPIVGSINLFGNGTNLVGVDVLLLAVIAVVLSAMNRPRDLIWPGVGASGILLYEFGSLQWRLAEMREALAKDLQDNPFAGLAQGAASAIQIQWGWLVLAAGAGLLVYAGFTAPRDEDIPAVNLRETGSRVAAALAVLLLLFAPAWDLISRAPNSAAKASSTAPSAATVDPNVTPAAAPTAQGPSADEAAYIKNNLRLYDLTAKYYDSDLDGRVPGVDFKIQNNGGRTLDKVKVRVVFYDAAGNPISEEEYYPVLVSDYSVDDDMPLRPHYIWQQESGKFYTAKNVPSEWAEGKVSASVTEIEFGPNT